MADFTFAYRDFKGGHWGIRDPAKTDADMWHGTNVYAYSTGLLGVRAGAKKLPVTGLPDHPIVPGPLGFWSGNKLMIFLGKPYQVSVTGGAATAWAALPGATPTAPLRFVQADAKTYVLSDGVLYKYATPSSVSAIVTPQPLSHIVRWGYYFVGVDRNVPWRLWYSTVDATGAHFDTWGANNYVDIGNTEPITSLNPIFNHLFVGKRSGWNAVSGVFGTELSVRAVALGLGPVDPRLTAVTTDNRILYWPVEPRPAFFNGERVELHSDIDVTPRSTPFSGDSVIVTPTARRVALLNDTAAGSELWSYAGRAWSHHVFPAKVGGIVPGNLVDGIGLPSDVVYVALAPTTVGDPTVIASINHDLDRPGHSDDIYAAPIDSGTTDMINGTVTFPSFHEQIGRQIQVRSVIVQFRKWTSGVDNSRNQMDLRVDALGAYGRGTTLGEIAHWDEPCIRANSGGTDDSWRINVGSQGWGNGFRVTFTKMVGVALREVVLLCNIRTERT